MPGSDRIRQLRMVCRSRPCIALTDQMIVSGTSFVTMVMVGRFCGSQGLGTFSLMLSLLLLASAAQLSLVCAPFTVFRLRKIGGDTPRIRAASVGANALLLAGVLMVFALLAAAVVSWTSSSSISTLSAWALLIALPGFLARDFARRFDFARLHMFGALALDTAVAALQLGVLYLVGRFEQLNGPLAILVIASISGGVTLVWLARRRHEFHWKPHRLAPTIQHDWRFGRWLLLDNLVCIVQLYAMHWMLSGMISTAAAGIFAACLSIAALANPFLQGVGNYLSPKIAETVSLRSRAATINLYWRSTAGLMLVVSIFTLGIYLFDEELLWFLYQDTTYTSYGSVVVLLALRMLCSAPTIAADHAVVAMESPRASAMISLFGVVLTVGLAYPLIRYYGVTGAAIALLIGTAIESFALVAVYVHKLGSWIWDPPTSSTTANALIP